MTESYALFLAIFYGKVILQKSYSHIPTIKLDTKLETSHKSQVTKYQWHFR